MAILSTVSYYVAMTAAISLSGAEFKCLRFLHYTQGIIREATAALLEDMIGHWIRGLPW
jgi:hypothetical protein